MEDKIIFWGDLDVSSRYLEGIPKPFKALYDEGHYRMRPEDIKRFEKYLKRINEAQKQIKGTLSLFKNIKSS